MSRAAAHSNSLQPPTAANDVHPPSHICFGTNRRRVSLPPAHTLGAGDVSTAAAGSVSPLPSRATFSYLHSSFPPASPTASRTPRPAPTPARPGLPASSSRRPSPPPSPIRPRRIVASRRTSPSSTPRDTSSPFARAPPRPTAPTRRPRSPRVSGPGAIEPPRDRTPGRSSVRRRRARIAARLACPPKICLRFSFPPR